MSPVGLTSHLLRVGIRVQKKSWISWGYLSTDPDLTASFISECLKMWVSAGAVKTNPRFPAALG